MTTLIKISQLPSATSPLSGTEVMTVVQGGVTKKISASAINDLIVSPVAAAQAAAEAAAADASDYAEGAATSAALASAQVASAQTYTQEAAISASNSAASVIQAQDWATKTDGEVVSSQGYGAKKYAQDAAASVASIGNSVSTAAASATAAATSEANALSSKNAAATSATTASTKASEAATSATASAASASTATTKASEASASASSASTSATNSAASAATATTKAGEASTSATNAAASATNASTSETNALSSKNSASASATTATTQAGISTTKAGEASTSASNASTSASVAATSEANALAYKNTAGTSASTATTQAGIATSQAGTATTQAGIATTKAGEAATSASAASVAQAAAESARDSTLAAFDSFDDRYLGAKSSDPTTDNDGNALVAGSLYYCTATGSEGMRVYTGSAWVVAYVSGGGYLVAASNLSDLSSASTARTNLGLATLAATGAYGDLTGKPTLFSGSYADLTNKPSLFSGVYADLTGKPTIPTVPTTVSSFTNDSGYLTSESDPVFTAHAAYGVTTTKLGNWDTAYGWGNHASAGYLTGITSGQVTGALGFTPYNATNPSGYITGINSSMVTTALGYTPYNSTNPSGYITSSGTAANVSGTVAITNGGTGATSASAALTALGAQPASTAITTSNIGSQSVNYATSAGNADTVDSLHIHTARNNEANKLVRTDASGYLQTGYINSSSGDEGNNLNPTRVWGTNGSDSYLRTYLTSALSVNYATTAGSAPANGGTSTYVTINYNNDSNSTYQMLWGSGNAVYGTGGIYCNPSNDYLYAGSFNCGNWFRSTGATGWFNESYAVGIYATEAGNVRTYNGANFISAGNVTAYSDERLKENWRDLPNDFVENLANVKSGIFDRTDNEFAKTQVGVSAQSLRNIMPNAVLEDTEGMLSVAYGNAALTACVELAKRVVALEAEIKALKG